MTTRPDPGERRLLVNLSVVAGSAAMLAASWLGVVGADDAGPTAEVRGGATTEVAQATSTARAATETLLPAPAPRRVVVTRQSRAS
jgi:hypothetical protein